MNLQIEFIKISKALAILKLRTPLALDGLFHDLAEVSHDEAKMRERRETSASRELFAFKALLIFASSWETSASREGKKLSREGIRRVSIPCGRHAQPAQQFLLFSYLDFRVYLACYPPESFKIICLTCIWSKCVDTSFHGRSSQNPQQNPCRISHSSQKNRCVTLITDRELELAI